MASEDSSGPRAASPIVLRIKLRYDDVEVMVQRFAANVGRSGLFLPTRSLQPVGSEIKFELRLADDTPVLVGLGRVKAGSAPDPQDPRAAFGMAIELMRVTPQSRALILRMLEHRRAAGLPEVSLPTAADVDAARLDAATGARAASGPLPVSAVEPVGPGESPGESLLTAPRRAAGPIAMASVAALAPLPPEPPRRKRMAVSEVIESASGPVAIAAAVPELDDIVDIAAAIARARVLAGGGALDAELEALSEITAAPIEISVEAASAELARQLGGHAVRRDRSARWLAPPATTAVTSQAVAPRGIDPASTAEPVSVTEPTPKLELAPDLEALLEPGIAPSPGEEVHQLDEFDLEDISPRSSMVDEAALAASLDAELAEAEAEDLDLASALRSAVDGELADAAASQHDLSLEEIDDFEILAEADADDEALLRALEVQDIIARPDSPVRRRQPGDSDFAARLDLGDSGQYAAVTPDPHIDSALHALSVFDLPDEEIGELAARGRPAPRVSVQPIFETEASSSFTFAQILTGPLDLDPPPEQDAEDHELEHALEALDVDLDDLSIPHAATELARGISASRRRRT
jgi:hypothetical protein